MNRPLSGSLNMTLVTNSFIAFAVPTGRRYPARWCRGVLVQLRELGRVLRGLAVGVLEVRKVIVVGATAARTPLSHSALMDPVRARSGTSAYSRW